ncbi:uncharacterized protein LOC123297072 isoform X2 [Chrysoperla carnea]|nr:uncharacterized protein LOC123297072 isoform X2 [Chrysoperla carnea]XP_044734732.1 uncharacterized protein LOC123297072 isoform X2 [Chrysoperla carnea]
MTSRIPVYVILVACNLIPFASQNIINNNIDEEPTIDNIAQDFLKNSENNDLLQNILQSESGKQLGGMVMENLLKSGGGSDLLSGLGSMLTDDKGALDSKMLGSMLKMFTENASDDLNAGRPTRKTSSNEPSLNGLIKDFTGDFLSNGNAMSLLSYLPMLMQTVTSYTEEDIHNHESEHASHSWLVPPVLEKVHIFWDHFTQSELGKSLYSQFGIGKILKNFADKDGNFNFDRFVELMDNQSFRRYWIKKATSSLADIISYFADPMIQKKYFTNVMFLTNGFLKARGYPKQVLFDTNRPTESISAFLSYFTKKYFSYKMDFTEYVRPIVNYVEALIQMAQDQSNALKRGISTHSVADKITDILNMEFIEPILRVFRAYRFGKRVPRCDKYVMCVINQEDQNKDKNNTLMNIRLGLSKISSFLASWFLSSHTNSSYWSLYQAITHSDNACSAVYPQDCSEFHFEELKVTTEYYHNEL